MTEPRSTEYQVRLAVNILAELPASRRVFLFVNISAIHQPNRFYLPGVEEDSPASQAAGLALALVALATTLPLAFLLHWVGTTRQSATVAIASTMLGTAWIGFGLAFLLLIRAFPDHGRLAAFAILLAVFAGDTAAFFAGRMLGRHRLAPTISPGKTWEGFFAGAVATVFVMFIALYQDRDDYLSIGRAIVLGVAIAIAAPLGDLFESALKRDMQVKDSGRLLGGHGGMLDRLDAILFASAASYYVLRAFGAA